LEQILLQILLAEYQQNMARSVNMPIAGKNHIGLAV